MRNPQAVREALVELGHQLLADGLVVRTWGNFSMRLSAQSFLITPSGRHYESMQPEDLSLITGEDKEGPFKPSSEYPMHATTYELFPQAACVIHTHQPYASALSLSNKDIELDEADAEALGQKVIPIAPYGLPSTGKLHKNVHRTLESTGARVILLRAHGALIWADHADEARRLANLLEEIARRKYLRTTTGPGPYTQVEPEGRIIHRDSRELADLFAARPDVNTIIEVTDTDVRAFVGRTLEPYLDDFAQLVGVKANASPKHNLVIGLKDIYALGADEAGARDVVRVSVKNARAARLATACATKPIIYVERILMNQIYQKKYSKQAD